MMIRNKTTLHGLYCSIAISNIDIVTYFLLINNYTLFMYSTWLWNPLRSLTLISLKALYTATSMLYIRIRAETPGGV